jgi:hypothetical protein
MGVRQSLGAAGCSDNPIALPHSPQNFSSGSTNALHFGQVATSAVPQFVQNLRPSRLPLPHFEQRIVYYTNLQDDGHTAGIMLD